MQASTDGPVPTAHPSDSSVPIPSSLPTHRSTSRTDHPAQPAHSFTQTSIVSPVLVTSDSTATIRASANQNQHLLCSPVNSSRQARSSYIPTHSTHSAQSLDTAIEPPRYRTHRPNTPLYHTAPCISFDLNHSTHLDAAAASLNHPSRSHTVISRPASTIHTSHTRTSQPGIGNHQSAPIYRNPYPPPPSRHPQHQHVQNTYLFRQHHPLSHHPHSAYLYQPFVYTSQLPHPQTYVQYPNPQQPTVPSQALPNSRLYRPKLPVLTGIHRLSSSSDWVPWHQNVTGLIDHLGLLGHIAPQPLPGALLDPTLIVVFPPPLDDLSTPKKIAAYREFWRDDDIVTHILTGRLSMEIQQMLPPRREGTHGPRARTARQVYNMLKHRYSASNPAIAHELKEKLFALTCSASTIPAHVAAWRAGVQELEDTSWPLNDFEKLQIFMDSIPDFPIFQVLRYNVWNSLNTFDPYVPYDFYRLADNILEIDIQRRRQDTRQQANARTTNPTSPDL